MMRIKKQGQQLYVCKKAEKTFAENFKSSVYTGSVYLWCYLTLKYGREKFVKIIDF